jgi:peptide deformylase
MAIRPILTIPHPVLRKKAKPIERVDADLRRLMDDMLATMYDAPGIGLAAPQIGISRRLIVMDPAKDEAPKSPIVMVNPEILSRSEEMRMHEEGCLSIPDFTAEIERPAKTLVAYIDREGKKREAELEGIWSTLVQHEIDHLNGVLFIDYLSRLKRDMVVRKFTKQKQKRAEAL